MSSVANPLTFGATNNAANYAGWSVPTGMPGMSGGGATPANPYMPQVNPSATGPANSNPYSSGFPANNGGYSSTPLASGGTGSSSTAPPAWGGSRGLTGTSSNASNLGYPTNSTGQAELFTNLANTYGKGVATTLMNFLSSGAGFNQAAVNNLIAAMQPGFQNAQQNLLQQFSAGGSRFSSGASLGLSNLESQEQLNIGALESQMYEQSVSNYMDVLMGTLPGAAQTQANQPSGWDIAQGVIGDVLGGAADVGTLGLASAIGSSGGGGSYSGPAVPGYGGSSGGGGVGY
jgi:hypothetical protein